MEKKMRMYILTDTHFVSKRLWVEGELINNREKGDQIAIKCTPEIFDTFSDIIISDEQTSHVLITGDLVNSGEKLSHEDFRKALKKLTDAGKRVYVTTATHDYCGHNEDGDENIFHAVYYGEKESCEAERVSRKELAHLYDDFGPNYADSIDEESGSYSLLLEDGYRLIALNDNGNGRSHCGLFDKGFNWLEKEIDKAQAAREYVLLAVHHPVLPPWEVYRLAADFEMFGGYEKLKELMCRKGVRVIFTGHTHVQNIRKYENAEKEFFYDISTTALVSAAGKMRLVSCEDDRCNVTSVGIDSINGVDTHGKSAYEYIYGLNFAGALEEAFPFALTDWERFVNGARALISADKLNEKKKLVQMGVKRLSKTKMSCIAALGGRVCGLTREEKASLKEVMLMQVVFNIMRHIYTGNGVYSPETAEFKALNGLLIKADKLLDFIKFDRNKLVSGLGSLSETARPFLYNDRTGDDDSISFSLK